MDILDDMGVSKWSATIVFLKTTSLGKQAKHFRNNNSTAHTGRRQNGNKKKQLHSVW